MVLQIIYYFICMNIFVGSLPYSIVEADLEEAFGEYGTVESVKIITDKVSGKSKGFGFIEMPNDEEALKAIEELNGATVEGRTIVVNKSEPKPQGQGGPRRSFNSGPRGGGNNRGGGGGNYRGGGSSNNRGGGYNKDRY